MEATVYGHDSKQTWAGGHDSRPMNSSYGKMMIWYFILSDALTFLGFLLVYSFMRFRFDSSWPIADEVFTHFPGVHGDMPMAYVALMTFILIASSVTMVLAVDYGHKKDKKNVVLFMFLTIVGGIVFLGSQAWEWGHFIHGSHGAIKLKDQSIVHLVEENGERAGEKLFKKVSIYDKMHVDPHHGDPSAITLDALYDELSHHPEIKLRVDSNPNEIYTIDEIFPKADKLVFGANLKENEYGKTLFADFFFFITGFHGFHVFSGVILNIIIFLNVLLGTYEKRGTYEMVEKVGLYWHFVDLVWVFVFTLFYLL